MGFKEVLSPPFDSRYAVVMRIHAHFLTLMLLLFSSTVARCGESLDDRIMKLGSDKPSEFRIAQVYLSQAESAPLDKLDELARTADDRLRQRIKEVVALILLNGIEPSEIYRRHNLYGTCKSEIARGRELARMFKKAVEDAQRINPKVQVQWYDLSTELSDWQNELYLLHGWGVPACLDLAESKSPFIKMLAINAIFSIGASPPADVLDRWRNDTTPVVMFYGDYSERSTIAKELSKFIGEGNPERTENQHRWNNYSTLSMLNQFEKIEGGDKHVGTLHKPTWSFDEYWRAVQREMQRLWDNKGRSGARCCRRIVGSPRRSLRRWRRPFASTRAIRRRSSRTNVRSVVRLL
jgi:hypothetical protein